MTSLLCPKDCEHSVVQLARPIKIKKTPFRSRQSLRASIIYKGPAQKVTPAETVTPVPVEPTSGPNDQVTSTTSNPVTAATECDSTVGGTLPKTDDKQQGDKYRVHHYKDLLRIYDIYDTKK